MNVSFELDMFTVSNMNLSVVLLMLCFISFTDSR